MYSVRGVRIGFLLTVFAELLIAVGGQLTKNAIQSRNIGLGRYPLQRLQGGKRVFLNLKRRHAITPGPRPAR